ncbi:MAG: hypothetical protein JJU40_15550, partial [Rhodobacteraceae bacterium]|nr:hypothetical protein [Paracoccaceae bacterium]
MSSVDQAMTDPAPPDADAGRRDVLRARLAAAAMTLGLGGALTLVFALGIAGQTSPEMAALALALFLPNALWISGGAAVALLGLGGATSPPAQERM